MGKYNYQPVMIRTLLNNGGKSSLSEIKKQIQEENPEKQEQSSSTINRVVEILTKINDVAFQDQNDDIHLLDYDALSNEQIHDLLNLCDQIGRAHV